MSQVGKLYKYYLKKSLWRSWKVWVAVSLCWVWWIFWPFAVVPITKQNYRSQLKRETTQYTEDQLNLNDEILDNEYTFKGTINKSYQGALVGDEESAKWWEEQAKLTDDAKRKSLYNLTSSSIRYNLAKEKEEEGRKEDEKLTKEEKEKLKREALKITPLHYDLVLFSARRNSLSGVEYWQLMNNITLWNMGGVIAGIFLVYSLLDNLFIQAKKNGEDATVLNFAPSVKRIELFISKSLSYITALALFTLLSFAIPYGVFLSIAWGVAAVPWGAFFLLLFYATVIGSILFFLFPVSLCLFASNLGIFGSIIYYFLSYFSLIWYFVCVAALASRSEEGGGFWSVLAKAEYWYSHPFVNIGLAVVLGGLFLFLYHSYYQEEDLG